ncbi:unnamed protein product [Schistosoma mattheei]|uniref:Uncharacterized protein n=1 Tax=Schistosoma mattheei TaxID=31246 RepID=A0A183NSF1_9TREM|nr:unnamed protein product [Schistosoma mattheei]
MKSIKVVYEMSKFLLFLFILLIIDPIQLVNSRYIDNTLLRSVLNCYVDCIQNSTNDIQDNNYCYNECFNNPNEKRGKFFMLG